MTRRAGDPDDPRRQEPPPRLRETLAELVRRRGWERRLEGARVHEVWDQIAGPQVARHVSPVRLHGGVLVLRADSSAWATQVRYLGPALVLRANEVLGSEQVSSVRIVTGHEPA